MLSNATLLSLCNSLASIIDSIIGIFGSALTTVGLSSIASALPRASSICTSLFGS